jgi:hypothetical protein
MSLIVNGRPEPFSESVDFLHEPRLALTWEDKRSRHTRWVRQIVLHATKGRWPSALLPGFGPLKNAGDSVARYWRSDNNRAGAHMVVDWSGTVTCHCDLLRDAAFHAGPANEFSVGIEIYQGGPPDYAVYEGQLLRVVELCDWLTARFSIQRQMPLLSEVALMYRCSSAVDLADIVGVIGHRHITSDRGRGDPGDHVFRYLSEAGYEELDFAGKKDLGAWSKRQADAGMRGLDCDGVPGPHTVDALAAAGHKGGLWVQR